MRTKIEVTAMDIAKGRRGSYKHCPIGKAAQRTFKVKPTDVFVSRSIRIKHNVVVLPKKAITFIDRFDDKLSVKPFTFTVPFGKD